MNTESRVGKVDSLFKSTEGVRDKRGRPKKHDDKWHKVTVIMLNRDITMLDQMSVDIRKETGTIINRASIIRVLIGLIKNTDLDLSAVTSEESLKQTILKNFRM